MYHYSARGDLFIQPLAQEKQIAQAPCNYSEIRAIADLVLYIYLSEDIGLCRRHFAPTLLQDETSGSCSGQWNTKCSTEDNYIVPQVDICPQEIFCSTREQLLERRPLAPQKIYFSIRGLFLQQRHITAKESSTEE